MPRQERGHHLQRAQLLLPLRQPGCHTAPRRAAQRAQTGCARRRRAAAHRSSPAPAQLRPLQRPARLLGAALQWACEGPVGLRGAGPARSALAWTPHERRPHENGRSVARASASAGARPSHRRSPSTLHLPSTSPPRTHVPSTCGCSPWFYPPPGTSSISTSSTTRLRGVPSPTSRAKLRTTFCERARAPVLAFATVCARGAYPCRVCRRPTYGFGIGRSASAGARQPRPSTDTGLFKYHMCPHSSVNNLPFLIVSGRQTRGVIQGQQGTLLSTHM